MCVVRDKIGNSSDDRKFAFFCFSTDSIILSILSVAFCSFCCFSHRSRFLFSRSEFRAELERLNAARKAAIASDLGTAVVNILSGARYERLDPSGPKHETISSHRHPIVCQYFYQPYTGLTLEEEEEQILGSEAKAEHVHAHNGWVSCDATPEGLAVLHTLRDRVV